MSEPKPLKILHLATHTGMNAGGAFEMLEMAKGMKERGHDVACVFNWRDGRAGVGERNFEPVEAAGIEWKSFRMEAFTGRVLGDRRRFRRYVRDQKFDIVHCHKPRAVRFALKTLRGLETPKIVVQRGNSYPIDENGRRTYGDSQISAIICVANELRRIAIDGGLDAQKIVTNYTGVDTSVFNADIDGGEARRELNIAHDAKVVGLLANFEEKKAHDEFLRVAVTVAREFFDVQFLLVGRGASEEFRSQLRVLELEKHVVLAGFRTDAARMLAAMDVSINVSTHGEGLTGAMRESLAMRKAVVCTDIGGNSEIVRDGETGRLITAGDADAFGKAVIQLLRDIEYSKFLAQNGYNLVMQKLTRERSLTRLESVYRTVVAGRALADAMDLEGDA